MVAVRRCRPSGDQSQVTPFSALHAPCIASPVCLFFSECLVNLTAATDAQVLSGVLSSGYLHTMSCGIGDICCQPVSC